MSNVQHLRKDAASEFRLRPLPGIVRHALFASAGALLVQGATLEQAQAGPQGGNVAAGRGQINTPNATTTVVQQQSHSLVVNWQTFNVAKNELVQFNQPSASANVLNRVLNQTPSQIFGSVNANGKVFLLNPGGVVIGKNARVNVGSLFMSSLDISDDDFMNGNYRFAKKDSSPTGAIINRGLIQAATGGSVTLVGEQVSNEGVIVADTGHVNLAAGRAATVDFNGDGLIRFEVDGEVLENASSADAAVANAGEIHAEGGQVLLTASTASQVFDRAINNSGLVRAGSIRKVGGKVTLSGFGGGVANTGTVDASGTSGGEVRMVSDSVIEQFGTARADGASGDGGLVHLASVETTLVGGDSLTSARSDAGKGGRVEVLGEQVAVYDRATVDASGDSAGGTVLVGGGYQGKDPDVQNARATYVGPNAKLSADARHDGDGGTVVVWSDLVTRAHGRFSARGAEHGGDGGLVETSGKMDLVTSGIRIDVNAPAGNGGLWFIDPFDVEINNDGVTGAVSAGPNFSTTGTGAQIDKDDIIATLMGGNDVSITTAKSGGGGLEAGNVTQTAAGAIAFTVGGDDTATLTINAGGTIDLNGGIAVTSGAGDGLLDIVLIANDTAGDQGMPTSDPTNTIGDVLINAAIVTNGGSFSSSGVGFDNTSGTITTGGGAVTLAHTSDVAINANITAGSVDISTTTGSIVGGAGTVTANALTLTATAGGIGIGTAVNTAATSLNLSTGGAAAAGDITLVEVGALNTSNVTLSTAGDAQTVSLTSTAGPLTLGANIGNATDSLALIALAGDIVGGAGTAMANGLTLTAAAGGIGIGTGVNTDVTSLSLSTGGAAAAGDVTLVEAGALNTSNVTLSTAGDAQTVSLSSTAGPLTLGANIGNATDSLALIALAGDIVGGAGTASANALTLTAAAGGIGIGTAVNTAAASLNLNTGGAAAAGDITLVEAGALNTSNVTLSTAGDAQTVSLSSTAGPLTLGANIGNATDSLALIALAGDIVGGAGTASANALTLTAASGGIGIGTAVNTDVTSLSLSTGGAAAAGDITLVEAGALNTSNVTLSTAGDAQTVSLSSTAGPLTLSANIGNATDSLALIALAGDIVGGAGAASANALTLTAAAGGIGIGTAVNTDVTSLSLSTGGAAVAGDITVIEASALSLAGLTTAASAQTVSLTSTTGDVTLSGAVGEAADNLTLIASTGNIVGGAGTVTANALTLTATSGGIGIGSAVNTAATSLDLTTGGAAAAGDITLVEAGALNTSNVTLSTAGDAQTVSLSSTAGPLTLDANIGNATDNLTLIATAGDVVGGAGTASANALTLTAIAGGIGIGTAVNTDVTSLSLSTGGAAAAGDITVIEASALSLAGLTTTASAQTVSLTATTGDVTLTGVVGEAADNLTLIASTGNIVGGAGTAVADALTLTATAGGIGIGTAVNTNAASLALTSGGALAAGNIALIEAGALNTSNVTLSTAASAQTVSLASAAGPLTLGVNIGNATDSLALTALAGDIVGGAGTAMAKALTLTAAAGGIGIGTTVNTDATSLSLSTGGAAAAGDITVIEASALSLAGLTTAASAQTVSLTSTTGDVTLSGAVGEAADNLTLIASTGNILGGAGTATANTLTLTAALGIGSVGAVNTVTGGGLNLTANGGDIWLNDNGFSTSQLMVHTPANPPGGSAPRTVTLGGVVTFDTGTIQGTDTANDTFVFNGAATITQAIINTSGASLNFANSTPVTLGGAVTSISTGTGNLTLSAGTASPAGALTLSAATTKLGGALAMPAGAQLTVSGELDLLSKTQLTIDALSLGGAVSGSDLTILRTTLADAIIGGADPVFSQSNLNRFLGYTGTLSLGGERIVVPGSPANLLGNVQVTGLLKTAGDIFIAGAGDINFDNRAAGVGRVESTKSDGVVSIAALGSSEVDGSGNITDTGAFNSFGNPNRVAVAVGSSGTVELLANNQIGSESGGGAKFNLSAPSLSVAQVVQGEAQVDNAVFNASNVESVQEILAAYSATGSAISAFIGTGLSGAVLQSLIQTPSSTPKQEKGELGFIDEGVFLLPSTFTSPERALLMPILGDPDFPGDQRPDDPDADDEWLAFFEGVVREYIASRYLLAEDATPEERAAVEALVTSELQAIIAFYEAVRERERTQLAAARIEAEQPQSGGNPDTQQQTDQQLEDPGSDAPLQQGALPVEGRTLGYVGRLWSAGGIGFEVRG